MPNYDADFHGWAQEQAALLRAGRLSDADIANIPEEIESMGRSEKRQFVNRFAVLLQHPLKWRAQPGLRGTSRLLTIEEQRARLSAHLEDNPSLQARLGEALAQACRLAVLAAQWETGLERHAFPPGRPWALDLTLDEAFCPA